MSSMIPKNVNIWWFHWSWIITRENPSKRFQKQFPDHHKELVNMNGNQSIISRKIAWYFQKKVTTDSFYSDETLGDTKYCLSDTPEIISKLVEEKFRKPPGNINYWTFPPRWTKLCNIHRGGGKFFFFFFSGKLIFTGELSRVDSPGALIHGVLNIENVTAWDISICCVQCVSTTLMFVICFLSVEPRSYMMFFCMCSYRHFAALQSHSSKIRSIKNVKILFCSKLVILVTNEFKSDQENQIFKEF